MVILLDGEAEGGKQVVVRPDLEGAIVVVGVGVNPDCRPRVPRTLESEALAVELLD